jgi:hypothetical protein
MGTCVGVKSRTLFDSKEVSRIEPELAGRTSKAARLLKIQALENRRKKSVEPAKKRVIED